MADLSAVEKQKYKIFKNQVDLDKPYQDQNILLKGNTSEEQFNKFKGLMESEKGFIGNILDAINPFASAEASDLGAIQDAGLKELFESQITGIQKDPTDLLPQRQIQDLVDPSVNINEFGVGDLVDPSVDISEFGVGSPNSLRGLDLNRFEGIGSLNVGGFDKLGTEGVKYDPSLGAFVDSKFNMDFDQPTGIARLKDFLPFGDRSVIGAGLNILRDIIPKTDPRVTAMRNFYGRRFGLTDTGQVASGIMKGYNPVSGGLLNAITGGRFGNEKTIGLQGAILDRIKTRTSKKTQDRLDQTGADKVKFAKDTKKLIDLGRQQGGAAFERAFERQTRAKDLDRMRGGVGR
tara:strand:- start:30 stop:1073 length:1044 start_codon:yes stop_codon:yes gene_type:complete